MPQQATQPTTREQNNPAVIEPDIHYQDKAQENRSITISPTEHKELYQLIKRAEAAGYDIEPTSTGLSPRSGMMLDILDNNGQRVESITVGLFYVGKDKHISEFTDKLKNFIDENNIPETQNRQENMDQVVLPKHQSERDSLPKDDPSNSQQNTGTPSKHIEQSALIKQGTLSMAANEIRDFAESVGYPIQPKVSLTDIDETLDELLYYEGNNGKFKTHKELETSNDKRSAALRVAQVPDSESIQVHAKTDSFKHTQLGEGTFQLQVTNYVISNENSNQNKPLAIIELTNVYSENGEYLGGSQVLSKDDDSTGVVMQFPDSSKAQINTSLTDDVGSLVVESSHNGKSTKTTYDMYRLYDEGKKIQEFSKKFEN